MANAVGFMLVDRWVKGNNVNVVNFLVAGNVMFQLDCIGPPSLECLFDVERLLQVQFLYEWGDIWILFPDPPLTRPHFMHRVPSRLQVYAFFLKLLVGVLHSLS